jgi:hypothetical protein
MLDAIVPVNSTGSYLGYLSAGRKPDSPMVVYLGDNADDIPPRLWREFTNICDAGSNRMVTHQKYVPGVPCPSYVTLPLTGS